MNTKNSKNIDIDPQETQEWISSLKDLIDKFGTERAHFILNNLIAYARTNGLRMPYKPYTDYINTIPIDKQEPYSGDRAIERRIKSIIRWNAMAMVVQANRKNHGIGGHISSYASSATLYEVGFNHFFQGPDKNGGDIIFFQGHVSPGIYSRSYLEGRITKEHLKNFRLEANKDKGLSSYPHPWLMPNYWQFATVSMGLGPIMAIYQARFMHYLNDRKLINNQNKKVWAFLGDGEMDEPESMGALTLASREKLNNLIFVINCNLQRLDGPVRGNSKIIQELEGAFRGAGWNVIKVLWGSDWDNLFEKDKNNLILKRMDDCVDGDFLKYIVEGGDYFRKHFWDENEELSKLVEHLTDDELENLRVGGHDPAKVYAAYYEAVNHKEQPTVILAQTIKGYGLGEAGEGRNITHQQKKLNEQELLHFRSHFNIPINDEDCINAPFYKPPEESEEINYLKNRRNELGGFIPQRINNAPELKIPDIDIFKELLNGSENRKVSTTMVFVRLLTILCKNDVLKDSIVPIIPDEARTFGIDPLFRELGIYSHVGQKYDPVDSDQFLYYREAKDGQILEEGISEAGSISSFIAAGTSYTNHNINLIPFFIYYSMFGFQRVGDFIWAAADMRTRGFLIGGTAGKTTLSGEGLQHQDGHSHLLASAIPNLRAYDPAFSYEIATIIHHGLKEMYEWQNDVLYYLTLENENYIHPPILNEEIKEGIIKGIYKLKQADLKEKVDIQLLAAGPMVNEMIMASDLLLKDWGINSTVWSVTSYSELHKEAEDIRRWNILHPDSQPRKSFLEKMIVNNNGPVIAISDYVKLVSEQISPYINCPFVALGTDGFGRSDTRENLRTYFEVNKYYIILYALDKLAKENKVKIKKVSECIKKYNIDFDKPNPNKV
ncbi:MAG: pyruvate dehydrogenase (acetyl-transferring), homodimeric type [Candidatus Marinimicrobia bacterium]|nr:pyruvate dehydrogenase (acetyl-transferring), homodimeric type [Candidatus Neomarinimicrobiota bacterium]